MIPIVGIIVGVIYMSKGDPESSSLGKTCLIISVATMVLACCVGGAVTVLPIVLEGMAHM
jgi:hypothetical protein